MQDYKLPNALRDLYELLILGNPVGVHVGVLLVKLLIGHLAAGHLHHHLGREGAVERFQRPGAGEILRTRKLARQQKAVAGFGAHQQFGHKLAHQVQFIEQLGGIASRPDRAAVLGFSESLDKFNFQSGLNLAKRGKKFKRGEACPGGPSGPQGTPDAWNRRQEPPPP